MRKVCFSLPVDLQRHTFICVCQKQAWLILEFLNYWPA
nr:MAG TPA_asm: hypothetical protein [Caudoviricetes sp.]